MGHGLEDSPNQCKDDILEWNISGRDLFEPTGWFCTTGQRRPCLQIQEIFIWVQAIFEGVLPPYRFVPFLMRVLVKAKQIMHCTSNKWMRICWQQSSTWMIWSYWQAIYPNWSGSNPSSRITCQMSDLKVLNYGLGIEFERTSKVCIITVNRRSYI